MQSIENAIIQDDFIKSVIENVEYNEAIIEYYNRFAENLFVVDVNTGEIMPDYNYLLSSNQTLSNISNRIEFCNKFWALDKYELHKIKDLKSQNLCRDKFCSNCKKVKQAARMAKYIPELEQYSDRLYHLTLTVPNCTGIELPYLIRKMAKAFKRLIRYMNGDAKIKNVDFESWQYEGAVRSLEVTFKDDDYHPHYHVGLVLNPDLIKQKKIINRYSYDKRSGIPELKRLFSDQEILIQKIWYLLMNGKKVTRSNIDDLEEGYTCSMDKFKEGDYAELFKYMTKERDQKGNVLTYENFVSLYYALYRVKQLQGYGCLFRIKDDVDLKEYEEKYKEFIENIRKKENPIEVAERPKDLLLDKTYTLISRKSYFRYLRTL